MTTYNSDGTPKSDLIKLSVSKTGTFNSCKKKYHFSYILKMPKKEYSYHTFGRFAHRILELFHLKYLEGSKENHKKVMTIAFNEAMQEFKGKITEEFRKEAFEIMNVYLKQIENQKGIVECVQSVEKVFNLHINDGLILTGMIDRVQLDPDGILHVADYKTSKSSKYLKEDTLQLLTYAYILYTENPNLTKVRVSYIMLRQNCEWITKEFSLREILKVKDIYEQYAYDMRNEKEFPPNITKLCDYCDFKDLCTPYIELNNKEFHHGAIKSWKKLY